MKVNCDVSHKKGKRKKAKNKTFFCAFYCDFYRLLLMLVKCDDYSRKRSSKKNLTYVLYLILCVCVRAYVYVQLFLCVLVFLV